MSSLINSAFLSQHGLSISTSVAEPQHTAKEIIRQIFTNTSIRKISEIIFATLRIVMSDKNIQNCLWEFSFLYFCSFAWKYMYPSVLVLTWPRQLHWMPHYKIKIHSEDQNFYTRMMIPLNPTWSVWPSLLWAQILQTGLVLSVFQSARPCIMMFNQGCWSLL